MNQHLADAVATTARRTHDAHVIGHDPLPLETVLGNHYNTLSPTDLSILGEQRSTANGLLKKLAACLLDSQWRFSYTLNNPKQASPFFTSYTPGSEDPSNLEDHLRIEREVSASGHEAPGGK
jgi:hypothetical protein